MARYIDAELLKKNIRVNLMPNVDIDGTVAVEVAERYFLNLIDKTSTADVAEVKHGSWTFVRSERKVVCSCCETPAPFDRNVGYHTLWVSPYCPKCGAKMDE